MTDLETLAEQTCRQFLTARDLAAICRHRGFNPPAGGKAALAAYLAPRLLSPVGAAEALASLEEPGLLLLHAIALAAQPLGLDELHAVVRPGGSARSIDRPDLFRSIAGVLLDRGIALVGERDSASLAAGSRLAQIAFHLPEVHRPLLPPFPVAARPLRAAVDPGAARRFVLEVLRRALARAAPRDSSDADGIQARLAAIVSFADGTLRFGGAAMQDAESVLRRLHAEWIRGEAKTGRPHFAAAAHILAHLPPGTGLTPDDLRAALARLGRKTSEADLARFCRDGTDARLLLHEDGCYRAVPVDAFAVADGPLAFRADDQGVEVDLAESGLGALLELASVSRAAPAGDRLRLVPDPVLLGRAADRLDGLAALRSVREASSAYERAARDAVGKHGKLLLHEGLLVIRVDDLGLHTLLAHELGAGARTLGGRHLAVPRGLALRVEKLVRREGFSPRRVQ